jgi:MFS family permease
MASRSLDYNRCSQQSLREPAANIYGSYRSHGPGGKVGFGPVLFNFQLKKHRTKWFFLATGLGALGRAPAFAVGGVITSWSGGYRDVFLVAASVMFLAGILLWLLMPETFGPEKREALRYEHERERGSVSEQSLKGIARVKAAVSAPFYFLGKLSPRKDAVTGKRNYRLLFLSTSFLCGSFVLSYAQGIVVYASTKFHFDAEKV